jgi:basic membrane protein A and related proteins
MAARKGCAIDGLVGLTKALNFSPIRCWGKAVGEKRGWVWVSAWARRLIDLAWLSVLSAMTPLAIAQPLEVGFVYVSPVGSFGWTHEHDQARRALERALGDKVRTRYVEAVPEGPDSERVMRDMAASGVKLIVATSFGYLQPALRVAADFPGVHIEHAGGHKEANNLATYNARFYEARWLAGYLAGRASRSGVAGYVAGFPIPEVIQGINAFTQGMRDANPKATVRVLFLNAWFDPPKEREAGLALLAQGADVLTHHSGSAAVPTLAQEKGVRLVAYQSDMRAVAPQAQLAAVVADWSGHYIRVAQAISSGVRPQGSVWGGMREGMVKLEGIDPQLAPEVMVALKRRRDALEAQRDGPFWGRLVDQDGRERQARGAMDDARVASMDWFVQGVVGKLPASQGSLPK